MSIIVQWVSEHSTLIQAGAAIIQAVAAGLIAYLTWRLAQSTHTYATLTKESLEVTQKQFEWGWQPNLHLTLFVEGSEARLRVINLSRSAVVVTHLFIKIEGKKERRQSDLNIPLPGLVERESGDLTDNIKKVVEPYVQEHAWSGELRLSVGFLLAGVHRPSEEVVYQTTLQSGYVTKLERRKPLILWERSP